MGQPSCAHSLTLLLWLLLQLTGGMNGLLLPCAGETNPSVVPAPYELGEDLTTNNVLVASFKNPPHQPHVARRAPGSQALNGECSTLGYPVRFCRRCLAGWARA